MTYETKKGNNKWKIKSVSKQGFCQPGAKYDDEKQANFSTRTSAKSTSLLKKTKSNLSKWTWQEGSLFDWQEVNQEINLIEYLSPLVKFTSKG